MRRKGVGLALALALALPLATANAANIIIVNGDGFGEGFNDPAPVARVGGNTGTTLGQQRLIVFQTAANIWGSILPSNVTIRVRAAFNSFGPQNCNSSGGVLGAAAPAMIAINFSGASYLDTWYPIALANRIAGRDLDPGDDIQAEFNSDVDGPNCLGSVSFYYGLDHNHGLNEDLLAVVLHELGHGLGFVSLEDAASGELAGNLPDIFTRFIRDRSTGKPWSQMTIPERQASAVNDGNVVWDGSVVTQRAAGYLAKRPHIRIDAPAAIAGAIGFVVATFGPRPTTPGITGDVVLVNPSDACAAITNAAQLVGKIALIDRGGCQFVTKAQSAQEAGAVAVLIVNNAAGLPAALPGTSTAIHIPVIGISQEDGTRIKARLGSATVTVTIDQDLAHLAGASNEGKVLLYAPNPVSAGSSISHWDPSAIPDLLMEPALTDSLGSDVDLTRAAFQDIGWIVLPSSAGTTAGGNVQMERNVPNPFGSHATPHTVLSFTLDRASSVEIAIYDFAGRQVKRLYSGSLAAGLHTEFSWDGTDKDGVALDSGIYFGRVRVGDHHASRRIALVR